MQDICRIIKIFYLRDICSIFVELICRLFAGYLQVICWLIAFFLFSGYLQEFFQHYLRVICGLIAGYLFAGHLQELL